MIDKKKFRERIIDCARQSFSKSGYRLSTMEEIAKMTGKSKSTIYYYFPAKEDIFVAVIEREAENFIAELKNATRDIHNPVEKFKRYVTKRVELLGGISTFYKTISEDFSEHLHFIEKIRNSYDDKEIQLVEKILMLGLKNGSFNIIDTSFAAKGIVIALKGLELPLFWSRESHVSEEKTQQLLHILLHGIMN